MNMPVINLCANNEEMNQRLACFHAIECHLLTDAVSETVGTSFEKIHRVITSCMMGDDLVHVSETDCACYQSHHLPFHGSCHSCEACPRPFSSVHADWRRVHASVF